MRGSSRLSAITPFEQHRRREEVAKVSFDAPFPVWLRPCEWLSRWKASIEDGSATLAGAKGEEDVREVSARFPILDEVHSAFSLYVSVAALQPAVEAANA